MSRFVCFALTWGVLSLATSGFALAQGALTELYGEGVHRYFAGDYAGADQILSRVVDSGSTDPRAHYFRGLVREMQGGGGQFDFENGARLEAEGKNAVGVGLALMRIQGHTRSKIEKARRDARVLVRQQQMMMEQARRDAGLMAPSAAEALPPVTPSDTGDDPFTGDGLRSPNTTDDPEVATPEVDATTDPFGDDTGAAPDMGDAPATDPFDTGTPAPASDPFGNPGGDTPAGGDASDPFGNPAPGGDGGTSDPFGDPFGT